MRRRIALSTLSACLIAAALLIAVAPRRTVADIAIQETLFDGQTILENYRYRLSVRGALDGDGDAFTRLIWSPCSGAASYEHGEVFAVILIHVGDERVAKMAAKLTHEDQKLLLGFLAVGFEYGSVGDSEGLPKFSKTYPKLSELLHNMNDYAALR